MRTAVRERSASTAMGGTPGTGTLAFTLQFNALTAGTSKITVTSQEIYDSGDQLVTVEHEGSSTVTVGALQTASKEEP